MKRERDEYKLMAEQLRDRYQSLKKRIKDPGTNGNLPHSSLIPYGIGHYDPMTHASLVEQFAANTPLAHVLLELTEQNKYLLFEVEELKTKLIDAEGDLKLLREQLRASYDNDSMLYPHHPYQLNESPLRNSRTMEEVVEQLETFRNRVSLMEHDLQIILDEKEELILSRDMYKRKVDRLNRKLNDLLRSPPRVDSEQSLEDAARGESTMATIDIDSLERENSFLKEKLRQCEEEKKLSDLMLSKYKTLLEKSNSKRNLLSSIGINAASNKKSDGQATASQLDNSLIPTNVVSSRQIQQFIASNGLNHLEVSAASVSRLRSLILALFEALCDKSSALSLHKKNNKLLGRRIHELEDKLRQLTTEKVLMLTRTDHIFNSRLGVIESLDEEEDEITICGVDAPISGTTSDTDAAVVGNGTDYTGEVDDEGHESDSECTDEVQLK